MLDFEFPTAIEKVIIASLFRKGDNVDLFEEDVAEMETLSQTAGGEIVDTIIQKLPRPKASTYFGPGKLNEIRDRMIETGAKTVIIDAELKPGQIQNIEKIIEGKVIDRAQLILDIFSLHAKTNESRIQVELAQLELLYPRLTKMWSHLSRQDGGIGTRGPGETQLESDRRLVQKKLAVLKKRLEKIQKSRGTQRKGRNDLFRCSLVGYTNVGKSTLLNAMSGANVLVENKLFATLDTSTRKTFIPGTGEIVISDTVGFLRKLPHHLVASFRSTLEVVNDSDLLLVTMDCSSQWNGQQMDTVRDVLDDLGAKEKPVMVIFNKEDLIGSDEKRRQIEQEFPNATFVSAMDKDSVKQIKELIGEKIVEVKREAKRDHIIQNETTVRVITG